MIKQIIAFTDVFNYGGGGILHFERHIKEQYFDEYIRVL